jgi:GntR family transcriptional regulator
VLQFTDRLSTRPPTSEEFVSLELTEDVPVIRQFRIIYADQDVPVEASILVKAGHLHELQYQVPVE